MIPNVIHRQVVEEFVEVDVVEFGSPASVQAGKQTQETAGYDGPAQAP